MTMLAHGFTWIAGEITSIISRSGYPGILLLMALSSAFVPIPSEIVLPFSGYLVSTGRFEFIGSVFAGIAGDVLGSIFIYQLGTLGEKALLTRYGGYLFLHSNRVEKAKIFYLRYGALSVFAGKMLPFLRSFISLPAGLFKMSFSSFLFSAFAGGLLWNFALISLGFFLGKNWNLLTPYFHRFDFLLFFCLAGGLCYWIWKKSI